MAKKELGVDRNGVKKTMRFMDYFGDGCGQGGLNLVMALSGQAAYFYTEKVGIAAATVSLVLFITKILDAFTDLPMGRIIDGSKNPKGKCRPWFLRMAIPFFISTLLLFTIPKGLDATLQLAYLLVTNVLFSAIVYTAVSVPYSALPVMRTNSIDERSKIQVTRNIFSYLFGAIPAITVIPITNMLGGTQNAWIKYGAVIGLVSALFLIICYKTTKETSDETEQENTDTIQNVEENEPKVTFAKGMVMLVKNKFWLFAMLTSFVYQLGYGLGNSSGTYYAKYIYGNDNLVAVSGGIGMIAMVLSFFIAGPVIKKFGLTGTIRIVTVCDIVKLVVMAFFPRAFWLNLSLACIGSLFAVAGIAAANVMVNNCAEYNEYLYGTKMIGMTNSAVGFASKVGMGLGSALVTLCLALSGYVSASAAQTKSVEYGIFAFTIYIPLALVIAKIIFSELYRPYEKMYGDILKKNAEKNA